tara:strand:- start:784 stop:1959 length:1176 start_codon:yes stop_codon:yes gene_type:complete
MGFLSKAWRGIKKVAKKIVKPIAKLFKPITKFFNKFGIVGQIGMMFLMPYAFGALSSFMGGALKAAGSWSQTLMNSANWGAKALGHGLDLIHKAGTMVKNVYSGISKTISTGVEKTGNFMKGKGFVTNDTVLSNNFLAEEATWDAIPSAGEGSFKAGVETSLKDSSTFAEKLAADATPITASADNASLLADTTTRVPTPTDTFSFKTPADSLQPVYDPTKDLKFSIAEMRVPVIKSPESIFTNAKDWAGRQLSEINVFNPESKIRTDISKGIQNFSLVDTISDATVGAVKTGGAVALQTRFQEELYEGLGGELPDYSSTENNYNIDLLTSSSSAGDYSVYNTVNSMQSANGNAWMSYNYSNATDITNSIDSSYNYNNYMNQFGKSMYDTTA